MKRFFKTHLILSLLLSVMATAAFADDPCARGSDCGEKAAKCERGCEGTSNSESCFAACERDYEKCTAGQDRKDDFPECDYPEIACQVGPDEYECKHKDDC